MTEPRRETVVITGASSGIGRALALAWASRKARLVLSARGAMELDAARAACEALGGEVIAVAGDVTRDADRRRLVDAGVAEFGGIDVLVNNAGRGFYGTFEELDVAAVEELFRLNVFAPVGLTQLALPHLRAARGTVVMMSSIAGVVAAPKMSAYAASKFALEAFAQGLRAEVAADGVRVVVIRPGPVATPFRANSVTTTKLKTHGPDDAQAAEEVAERTLSSVLRSRAVHETSAYVHVASFAARVLPPVLRFALARMARSDEV